MKQRSSALILLAAGIALALWTWGTWGDVQVDWGREVYAAWRVSEGEALYRDVACFTGPLSPWVNGLWFKLFGAGIWTLYVANLLLIVLDTALVYALVRRLADRFTATAAGLVFLALFAFGRFQYLNDSNYVAPYAQEFAHALPLALGCLLALERRPALAGGLYGLVFLTKPEYSLALAGAVVLQFLVARPGWRSCGRFVGAAFVAPFLAWTALAGALGAREALLGVIGGWRYVFDGRFSELAFYQWVMGTDRTGQNFVRMLEYGAAELLLLGACAWTAHRLRNTDGLVAWIAGLVLGPLLVWLLPIGELDWLELARPWPLFALGFLVFARRDGLRPLAFFSLLLLAKMALNTRLQMYGFALALPATLLVCLLLSETLPRLVAARGGSFVLARALGCGVLLAFALGHLRVMGEYQRIHTNWMGEGRDAFRADTRGRVVAAALKELQQKLKPGERFAVLPEGVMLNYLARVPTPSRYVNFMPPEFLMYGEAEMLAELRTAAPAAIVLLHKDTSEYGFRWFGKDYGRLFGEWIDESYAPGALFGEEPLRDGSHYGARIMWRRDLAGR